MSKQMWAKCLNNEGLEHELTVGVYYHVADGGYHEDYRVVLNDGSISERFKSRFGTPLPTNPDATKVKCVSVDPESIGTTIGFEYPVIDVSKSVMGDICYLILNDNGDRSHYEPKYFEVTETIHTKPAEQSQPKEGELVEVRDSDGQTWERRIYLCTIPKADTAAFVCVNGIDEKKYKKGEKVNPMRWQQMQQIIPHPEPKPTVITLKIDGIDTDMTVEQLKALFGGKNEAK